MKINTRTYGETLGLSARRQNTQANTAEKIRHDLEDNSEWVNVKKSKSLYDQLNTDTMSLERAEKIAQIKKQVQSGEYFANRTVSDIASILEKRIGDEIEIEKIFSQEQDE
jgi:anti-sigma28 factor (negative regulator of flagellin synthesis)